MKVNVGKAGAKFMHNVCSRAITKKFFLLQMRFGGVLIFLGFLWGGLAELDYDHLLDDYLEVFRPHSGEKVLRGKLYTLVWKPVHSIPKVNLTLFHGGREEGSDEIVTQTYKIASEVENTGKFEWLVPADLPSSYGYSYKVTNSTSDDVESHAWSSTFTILKEGEELNEAGVVEGPSGLGGIQDRFVHPNGNDNIICGEPFDIIWIPLVNVSQVTLLVAYNEFTLTPPPQPWIGMVNMTIATNVTNNGKYTWNVPAGLADEVASQNAGTVTVVGLVPSDVDDIWDQDQDGWWYSTSPNFVTPAGAKKDEEEQEAEESAQFVSSSSSSFFFPFPIHTGDITTITAESKSAGLASSFNSSFSGLSASGFADSTAVPTKSSSSARVRDSIESTTTPRSAQSQSPTLSSSSRVPEPSKSVTSTKSTESTSAGGNANGAISTSFSVKTALFAIMACIF